MRYFDSLCVQLILAKTFSYVDLCDLSKTILLWNSAKLESFANWHYFRNKNAVTIGLCKIMLNVFKATVVIVSEDKRFVFGISSMFSFKWWQLLFAPNSSYIIRAINAGLALFSLAADANVKVWIGDFPKILNVGICFSADHHRRRSIRKTWIVWQPMSRSRRRSWRQQKLKTLLCERDWKSSMASAHLKMTW